jgi:prepilin-type N-terminal cleavage/methylation domain-containing protein/prepilin-type processing-associated H-X9-DG protein
MCYGVKYMKSRLAFTLVELLVVIAIIAVLLAILVGSLQNVRGMSQRLTCQAQLKDSGACVSNYATQYDGRMPRLLYDRNQQFSTDGRYTHAHYIYAQLDNSVTYYGGPGALWKAGLVPDGKQFYCKAVDGWLDEYKKFCDPTPWGTLPQNSNTTYQCIFAYRGYLYWPQSRKPISPEEFSSLASILGGNGGTRYTLGYPTSPYQHTDLAAGKAMMVDWSPHTVRGSGYNVNALFGDGHVALNPMPKEQSSGKYIQPYQASYNGDVGFILKLDPPYNVCTDSGGPKWTGVWSLSRYMFQFQP